MPIGLFDTETPLLALREQIAERLTEVVERGVYILGPEVKAFEQEFADYLGVKHVIGVGNGTDAITISLRALGVGRDDEVVVPSFTFYASAEAIVNAGARPVFCDVDPATRNVTAETVRAALTPRTKAIVAVDLFGCPAPVPSLRELGVPVLEDAAQAAGASLDGRRAGALGDIATFSFYPSKNLGAFGDGGAITTDDDRLAELARALRFHGSRDKQTFEYVGFNSRLDELQAAVLRILLPELDGWSDRRRAAARGVCGGGHRAVRDPAGGARRRRAGVAPVHRDPPSRRRADRGSRRPRGPGSGVLPHAVTRAARDGAVGATCRLVAGDRRARADEPGAADERGARFGACR